MNIAFITAGKLPVPAVNGGATENMLTHLLNQNEKQKKFNATIFCYYNSEAEELTQKYRKTNWHFYKGDSVFDRCCNLFWRGLRKLTFGNTYLRTSFIRWCLSIINSENFDLVVIEGNHYQVLQLKKATRVPIVLHMHIDGLTKKTDNGLNILNSCKGVVAISEYCKNSISEIDKSQVGKIFVLKNTVDINKFDCKNKDALRADIREKYGINEKSKVFVYCGRLTSQKGVMELIDAFISLQNEDCCLLVIGSSFFKGSKKDDFVKQLERKAEPYKDRIFFTGYISQEELPNYYCASDISVMPSKWEAAGNVIIEALACGLPVIASDAGGIPEYADEAACLSVKMDEHYAENLMVAMQRMISDTELYTSKKQRARESALNYGIENYYQNWCDTIHSIMEQ